MILGETSGKSNGGVGTPVSKMLTLVKDVGGQASSSGKLKDGSTDLDYGFWEMEGTGNNRRIVYTLVLDDITVPGGHFANTCEGLIPGENIALLAKPGTYSFSDTDSFYNKTFGNDTSHLAFDEYAVTNSIFGYRPVINGNNLTDWRNVSGNLSTASINNSDYVIESVIYTSRHLENLADSVSGVGRQNGNLIPNLNLKINASQIDDIAWAIIRENDVLYDRSISDYNDPELKPFLNEITKAHKDMAGLRAGTGRISADDSGLFKDSNVLTSVDLNATDPQNPVYIYPYQTEPRMPH